MLLSSSSAICLISASRASTADSFFSPKATWVRRCSSCLNIFSARTSWSSAACVWPIVSRWRLWTRSSSARSSSLIAVDRAISSDIACI
jgi:hypothetical protein